MNTVEKAFATRLLRIAHQKGIRLCIDLTGVRDGISEYDLYFSPVGVYNHDLAIIQCVKSDYTFSFINDYMTRIDDIILNIQIDNLLKGFDPTCYVCLEECPRGKSVLRICGKCGAIVHKECGKSLKNCGVCRNVLRVF